MMYKILPRSTWTSTSPGGTPITWSRVRGIVCHYPAAGRDIGVISQADETRMLRGWRNYHTQTLGWADIGYNYALGQSGRIYQLRGDRVGGHTYAHNSTTLGVLFIVGDDEELTGAAVEAFRALRATLRRRGAGPGLWGHREMPRNSTRCPGPFIMADIKDGTLLGAVPVASSAPAAVKAKPVFADVDWTQRTLNRLYGAGLVVDGVWGPKTAAAVKSAQKRLGITVDGRPGPATRAALRKALDKQKAPKKPASKKPAQLAVDGKVGPATVRALQKRLGVTIDGKAGHNTWRALQRLVGTPVDGVVSSQYRTARQVSPLGAITQGWQHVGRGARGSLMVRGLQRRVGVTVDGIWGPDTTRALQRWLNAGGK